MSEAFKKKPFSYTNIQGINHLSTPRNENFQQNIPLNHKKTRGVKPKRLNTPNWVGIYTNTNLYRG